MADAKTDALVKSVAALLHEKKVVAAREKELIGGLNAVLEKMGYRVVAADGMPRRRGRPPGSGNGRRAGRKPGPRARRRRRGRPPAEVGARPRGRPPKAQGGARRRGRPPKNQPAA